MTKLDKTTPVTYFSIDKLYGYKNFSYNFGDSTTIFIGENGIGKTTIMSILYYTLKADYLELSGYDFKSITIGFGSDARFTLTAKAIKSHMRIFNTRDRHTWRNRSEQYDFEFLRQNLTSAEIEMIINLVADHPEAEDNPHEFMRLIQENSTREEFAKYRYVTNHITYRSLLGFVSRVASQEVLPEEKETLFEYRKFIKENLGNVQVKYFPTYRRIEENFNHILEPDGFINHNLSSNRWQQHHVKDKIQMLSFGMKDIQEIFDEVLGTIQQKSIQSFNELSAKLLQQYLNDDVSNDLSLPYDEVKISLERLGDIITDETRIAVLERITPLNFVAHSTENEVYLRNFVNNLVKSYQSTKSLDARIKLFVDTVNQYLQDKQFDYNVGKLTIKLINKYTHEFIKLEDLSSGEKQIVSIFAQVYLTVDKMQLILFDEPELSISIEWQNRLLIDLLKADNIVFLMCVTHSPFIFEAKDLFSKTKNIGNYITNELR